MPQVPARPWKSQVPAGQPCARELPVREPLVWQPLVREREQAQEPARQMPWGRQSQRAQRVPQVRRAPPMLPERQPQQAQRTQRAPPERLPVPALAPQRVPVPERVPRSAQPALPGPPDASPAS